MIEVVIGGYQQRLDVFGDLRSTSPRDRTPESRFRMSIVLRLAPINRLLSCHRRTTALVGVVIVLGVGALGAHAALPEHHHEHGAVTVCIAALAIAGLVALGWCKRSTPSPATRLGGALLMQAAGGRVTDSPRTSARAGPPGLAVLRL
jgi:hypothetical protein